MFIYAKRTATVQPTADLTAPPPLWNAALRWGLQDAPSGWEAVRDGGGGFIFANNLALINLPLLLRFQLPPLSPLFHQWALVMQARLTHEFENPPVVAPYTGDAYIEWELTLSDSNRYKGANLLIAGTPGEAFNGTYVQRQMAIRVPQDFQGAGGTADSMTLRFNSTAEFKPGFLIDRLWVFGA